VSNGVLEIMMRSQCSKINKNVIIIASDFTPKDYWGLYLQRKVVCFVL
jgi:hypothetical protein